MSRRRALGAILGLLAATAIAYLPAFRAGFIWDDDDYVTENQALRSAGGLVRIWTEPGIVPQYYPLVHTTFWLEYHLWGLNPAGFHAVNVALHAANAVLVWLVLRRLELRGAWLVAAVFALHPVHVESVVWITERKNTLSTMFYLLALLAYLRYAPLDARAAVGPRARRWHYALALACYIAALLSKTVTCSLPAAILLITWWKRGRLTWRDVTPLVYFFLPGIALGLFTMHMEVSHVGAEGADFDLSFLDRVLIAGRAVWFYVGKLFWPDKLAFIYDRWDINPAVLWQYLYPVAALTFLLTLWFLRRRLGRGPLVAALFFGGTLLPALGFFNVYPMRFSFVADHFQYLASLGVITLTIAGCASLPQGLRWRWAAPALGTALLLVLGFCTWQQARLYDNVENLWRDTLTKSPSASVAANNLWVVLGRQGRFQEAIPYLEAAVRIHPSDGLCLNNLGSAYADAGRLTDALRAYQAALALSPNSARLHYNLGTTYAQAGRLDEAIEHLTRAVRLDPQGRIPAARDNLALARRLRATQPASQPVLRQP